MSPLELAAVALGGFLGAPARFLLDRALTSQSRGDFPWGTLAVNATGAFALGALTGLVTLRLLGGAPAALLTTGLCGAYTTFSTFSFETVRLVESGNLRAAAANACGGLVLGLLAAGAGLAAGLSA